MNETNLADLVEPVAELRYKAREVEPFVVLVTFAVVALAAFVTAANVAIAVESLAPVPMLDASHLTTEVVALCLRSQETAAEAEVKYVERELDTVVAEKSK